MLMIGEKINGTRKSVAKAIEARDEAFIKDLATRQFAAGAKYLDVNAGTPPAREPDDLVWLVNLVQAAAPEATICLDSANPAALSAGIAVCAKKPMINSLSGEKARVEGVLPLAAKHQTELVVLGLNDKGIPVTSEERLTVVRELIGMCRAQGLADEKLYVDPLVLSIATGTGNCLTTLATMTTVKAEFPQVHLTCGHSNISFGMPLRSVINQAFMVLTVQAGLDSAIVDPENRDLVGIMLAAEALMNKDRHCMTFNKSFRAGKIGPVK